ncbi:MAG: pyruvate/oxaloacetate carboxyltransferase [Chloroflexi bacterium]|nr:pyruvate/oxaloacetate carboxyltransferase [Chloroflexota bacterium]
MGILITDTTLRDAHQSLIATRMRTRDMLPIAEKMDRVGFFSLEVWGGATFDTCIRFLNEDPWERLRVLRNKIKNTRLQMLLRGQNLVGYRHYADDVVKEFVRLSVRNGIDVFRVFDALNDIRNMELSIRIAKEQKAHVQGTICYTTSPVHTIDAFTRMAVDLENLGCDSICIKDMAGLISPEAACQLTTAIKKQVKVPIDLHSHCSSGMAPLSYYTAAQAGIDILDTALSPFAWGTSQPPTESMVASFKDTQYDTGLDLQLLYELGEEMAVLTNKYRPLFTADTTRPSVNVLLHQIPGGMISNLISQLREQKALDKLPEILEEVPKVRADLGYPPLVTPTSQLVGSQAVLNVISGGRYKKVTKEIKDYFLGYYGRPPGKIDEKIRKQVIGNEHPIKARPGELIPPELEKLRDEGNKLDILHREEDLITYALYPQVAVKFLRGELKEEIIPTLTTGSTNDGVPAVMPTEFSVDVDGEVFTVKVSPVTGKPVDAQNSKSKKEPMKGSVISTMAGMVLAIKVKVGDVVNRDDLVATVEAMKMENDVYSPHAGIAMFSWW